MPRSLDPAIPPTPTAADYAVERDRPLIPDTGDPVALLRQWLAEARETEPNDPAAMALATADPDGMPDVRIVLLKDITEEGLVWYTNLNSAKGVQLRSRPYAALCFHWKSQRRQVRVRGIVEPGDPDKATAYFQSRARASQIAAAASDQSRPLESRDAFRARIAAVEAEHEGTDPLPRPEDWGGFRLLPSHYEFWQDQAFRMHDRLAFRRQGSDWVTERLWP